MFQLGLPSFLPGGWKTLSIFNTQMKWSEEGGGPPTYMEGILGQTSDLGDNWSPILTFPENAKSSQPLNYLLGKKKEKEKIFL